MSKGLESLKELGQIIGDKRTYEIFLIDYKGDKNVEHYQFKIMEVQ